MVDVTSDEPRAAVGRKSRLLASVAVGLLGVVAVAFILTRDDGAASALSVANAFMEARDNLDAEATLALFAADIPISDGFIEELGEYPVYYDWLRTSNWRWTVGECAETSTGEGGTLVRCEYVSENDWTRSLSQVPVAGLIDILVTNGEITGLVHTGEIAQFDEVWDEVTVWVENNHPETIDQTLTPDLRRPILDADSVALWEQYTEEFVASMELNRVTGPVSAGRGSSRATPRLLSTRLSPDTEEGHPEKPR